MSSGGEHFLAIIYFSLHRVSSAAAWYIICCHILANKSSKSITAPRHDHSVVSAAWQAMLPEISSCCLSYRRDPRVATESLFIVHIEFQHWHWALLHGTDVHTFQILPTRLRPLISFKWRPDDDRYSVGLRYSLHHLLFAISEVRRRRHRFHFIFTLAPVPSHL